DRDQIIVRCPLSLLLTRIQPSRRLAGAQSLPQKSTIRFGKCKPDGKDTAWADIRNRRVVMSWMSSEFRNSMADWPWAFILERNERGHAYPVRHRQGRSTRRRTTSAAGLRRAAQAGRTKTRQREARPDAAGDGTGARSLFAIGFQSVRRAGNGQLEQPRPFLCRRGRGHAADSR